MWPHTPDNKDWMFKGGENNVFLPPPLVFVLTLGRRRLYSIIVRLGNGREKFHTELQEHLAQLYFLGNGVSFLSVGVISAWTFFLAPSWLPLSGMKGRRIELWLTDAFLQSFSWTFLSDPNGVNAGKQSVSESVSGALGLILRNHALSVKGPMEPEGRKKETRKKKKRRKRRRRRRRRKTRRKRERGGMEG